MCLKTDLDSSSVRKVFEADMDFHRYVCSYCRSRDYDNVEDSFFDPHIQQTALAVLRSM